MPEERGVRRVFSAAGSLCFLGFAALQLNDPDPWSWGTFYVVAALALGLDAAGLGDRRYLIAVAGLASVWAVLLVVTGQLGGEPMKYGPTSGPLAQEGVRELLGLGIVALVCGGLAVWQGESGNPAPG